MSLLLSDRLRKMGTVVSPHDGNTVNLDRSDGLWIVLEGKVDLFVCSRLDSGELGTRHHVLRLEPAHALFALEPPPASIFVATATPSSRLLALPLEAFDTSLGEGDKEAAALLDRWLLALGQRFCASSIPLSSIDASRYTDISLDDEARAIVTTDGVVWVTQTRGRSLPLADPRLAPLGPGTHFPVSRYCWLQAEAQATLAVDSTLAMVRQTGWQQGLGRFHRTVIDLLEIERSARLAQQSRRIRQRSSVDAALVTGALGLLARPINAADTHGAGAGSCTHPVFLAMQAVAAELGIPLAAPAVLLEGHEVFDPVGEIAKTSAIRTRKVALKGAWWRERTSPLLCFAADDQRPIALLLRPSHQGRLYDPTANASLPLNEHTAAQLNLLAYALYRPLPARSLNGYDLVRFGLARCRQELLLIAATGTIVGALAIVYPFATGLIFDRLIPGAERHQLLQTSVLLLVVALTSSMLMYVRGFATLRLQGKMDADLQAAVWDRLLALPVSFFRDYGAGDLAQRSMGIAQIRETLTGAMLNSVLTGLFSIFSLALLFFYSVRLALLGLALVAVACLLSVAGGAVQLRYGRQMFEVSGNLSSMLLQFVSGMARFRVSGTEGRAFAAWARQFSLQKKISFNARRVSSLLLVVTAVFPVFCLAAVFYVNAHLDVTSPGRHPLTIGAFLAFLAAYTQFLLAALSLTGTAVGSLNVVPLYERILPILRTLPESSSAKSSPRRLVGEIEISHVHFSYRANTPPVLRDLTLRIQAGQSVAFVGSSGCGKSTLFRILLGFERPDSGTVYFDGQDLAGLDHQALRRQIGVVLQTSRPVAGSIFENIVGSAPLTVDDAWEACRLAGIEEDIRRMPMGLHTNLSDGGGGISGGQRQRLMIARAIVGKPRIILFDEATSALDNRTQAIVSRSLAGLQVTRIVIAHRLSTVVNVDRIFVFDKGSVVESGTYAELMDCRGFFHELASHQLTT